MGIKVDGKKINKIIHKLVNIVQILKDAEEFTKEHVKVINSCEKKLMKLRHDILLSIEEDNDT